MSQRQGGQSLSTRNWNDQAMVFHVVRLPSTVARLNFEILSPINCNFLLVREIPFPFTTQVVIRCNQIDPGLPLVVGDRLFIANTRLDITNAAAGAGAGDIVLVFSVNPRIFSAT